MMQPKWQKNRLLTLVVSKMISYLQSRCIIARIMRYFCHKIKIYNKSESVKKDVSFLR